MFSLVKPSILRHIAVVMLISLLFLEVLSDFLSSATEAYDSLKCSDIDRVEDLSYADGNGELLTSLKTWTNC